jgi:hypothetical protein
VSEDDQYIPVADLPSNMVPLLSMLVGLGAKARIKDVLLEVDSINDKKGTVTFKFAGIFASKVADNSGN